MIRDLVIMLYPFLMVALVVSMVIDLANKALRKAAIAFYKLEAKIKGYDGFFLNGVYYSCNN